jgi:hypothetical protein
LAELQYLGEADFTDMQDTAETPEVRSTLRKLGRDAIEKEQYLDFLKCRRFRQTLLCHAGERLNRRLDSAQVREFYIAAARHEEPPRLPADHPMARAAMAALREAWPGAMGFGPLMAAVRERAGEFDEDEALVSDVVLACFACGIVQLHVRRPEFARTVSERPRASSVARFQAARGTYVTSLCHRAVNIEDDVARRLLIAADGSRDAAALSLGAEEVAVAIADEARARTMDVTIVRNGTRGMVWLEPLPPEDAALLEAAADLGDGPVRRFFRITLPLSLPGVIGAAVLIFVRREPRVRLGSHWRKPILSFRSVRQTRHELPTLVATHPMRPAPNGL